MKLLQLAKCMPASLLSYCPNPMEKTYCSKLEESTVVCASPKTGFWIKEK